LPDAIFVKVRQFHDVARSYVNVRQPAVGVLDQILGPPDALTEDQHDSLVKLVRSHAGADFAVDVRARRGNRLGTERQTPRIPQRVHVTCGATARAVSNDPEIISLGERAHAAGGTIYCGRALSKLEQIERLARHGLPVPLTSRLTPDLSIDLARWGRYAVVKPLLGRQGEDVYLVRTVIAPRC
jgi:hypothetical protein